LVTLSSERKSSGEDEEGSLFKKDLYILYLKNGVAFLSTVLGGQISSSEEKKSISLFTW